MWVRQFASWANIYAKQFHACDDSEVAMKTKIELGQASIYINDNKRSKKSSKQYSHKWKYKKQQNATQGMGRGITPIQLSWMWCGMLELQGWCEEWDLQCLVDEIW